MAAYPTIDLKVGDPTPPGCDSDPSNAVTVTWSVISPHYQARQEARIVKSCGVTGKVTLLPETKRVVHYEIAERLAEETGK